MRRLLNWQMGVALIVLIGVILLNILPQRIAIIARMFHWLGYIYMGDKIGHAALFALLVLVSYMGLSRVLRRPTALIWAAGGAFVLSMGTEFAQVFVRSRSANWADLTANWLGILAAGAVITAYYALRGLVKE